MPEAEQFMPDGPVEWRRGTPKVAPICWPSSGGEGRVDGGRIFLIKIFTRPFLFLFLHVGPCQLQRTQMSLNVSLNKKDGTFKTQNALLYSSLDIFDTCLHDHVLSNLHSGAPSRGASFSHKSDLWRV